MKTAVASRQAMQLQKLLYVVFPRNERTGRTPTGTRAYVWSKHELRSMRTHV